MVNNLGKYPHDTGVVIIENMIKDIQGKLPSLTEEQKFIHIALDTYMQEGWGIDNN